MSAPARADTRELDRIAAEIHAIEKRTEAGLANVVDSRFAIGHRLLAARSSIADDQGYGRWFRSQGFGFSVRWGATLRAAAANEVLVRAELARQTEPNLDTAVKAVTLNVRQEARRSEVELPTGNVRLPTTITVACRDARDHFPGETADLAVFSPPYPDAGIVYDGQTEPVGLADWVELVSSTAAVLVDGWRVARVCMVIPSGTGRSPYTPLTGLAWAALTEAGFAPEAEIVWDKATTGNRTTWGSWRLPTEPRLRDRHEIILVARSGHALRIPGGSLVDEGTGRPVSPWLTAEQFTEATQSVWQIAPERAMRRGHPAPFPPALVERLLRLYGWPGCAVVDPFAGSGTVGAVALALGASAVLGDQSETYCKAMRQRLGIHAAAKPRARGRLNRQAS